MKIPKLKLNRIKILFKKLPRVLGEHAFLTFLVFVSLALIFGGFIFYKYSILIQRLEPEVLAKPIQFKEEIFQKVLEEWQARENRFQESESKEYPNPFEIPTPATSSATSSIPEK